MATAKPIRKDDPLRARDAQTVISPGVAVGPADDDRLDREPPAMEAAPPSEKRKIGWLALGIIIALGVVVMAVFAI